MPTNNFPGVGFTTLGYDHNFFQKLTVTATSFGSNSVDGYQPDMVITLPEPTYTVTFFLEGSSSDQIQYSFNGTTIHGDMTFGKTSANLIFTNRVISKIWFQTISGTPVVRVEAWGVR
jgi:hypothetical protein